MPNQTPLRIVDKNDSLPDWMFGERLDDSRLLSGDCRTLAVLRIDDNSSLYIALTADFDWICDHCEVPLYSDWEHLVVERVPRFVAGHSEPTFTSRVSLIRLPLRPEAAVDSEEYHDVHKLGGESYWLNYNPTPHLLFIGQIAFPDGDDMLLNLDWPTGEMTVEILYNTLNQTFCILWRAHA